MCAFVKRKEDVLGTLACWKEDTGSLSRGPLLTSAPDNTGRAQANEQRYSKLKEKYSELVQNHADLLRKVGPPTCLLQPGAPPTPQGRHAPVPPSSCAPPLMPALNGFSPIFIILPLNT